MTKLKVVLLLALFTSLLPVALALALPRSSSNKKIATPAKDYLPTPTKSTPKNSPPISATDSSISSSLGVPILTYHYVSNNPRPSDRLRDALSVSPDKFEEQMHYLQQNGYTPVTLDTLYGIFNKQTPRPTKPIVLTFDDGYEDFFTIAFPILEKYRFQAVQFLPTGFVDRESYLTWDQVKQVHASGLISFQAHTIHHVDLTKLDYSAALAELKKSKTDLERINFPVNFIAYPYGKTNNQVAKAAAEAGFVGGLGTRAGKAGYPSFNLPRIRIGGNISLAEFARRIN